MPPADPSEPGVSCRQCSSRALDELGTIAGSTLFAGQILDPPWSGGSLYRCRRCHLCFRHPVRSEAEYEHLYEQASEGVWVSGELRSDQRLVKAHIEASRAAAGKVLDVGCYDGSLLASLAPRFGKFGIEASAEAAHKARQRGVEIIGTRIRDLASIAERFDVISAVDVIEHVVDPRAFIAVLADRLLPGGLLMISTGSTDSPAWQWAGGRYWYCSFPEHISFISPGWAQAAAPEIGLDVLAVRRFAYGDVETRSLARMRRRYYRKVMQMKLHDLVRGRFFGPIASDRAAQSLGQPGIFEDHVLIIFKRRAVAEPAARTPDMRSKTTIVDPINGA